MASHHVVAIALDRVLAIIVPIWHRTHSNPKIARVLSFVITLYSYISCMGTLYYFGKKTEQDVCDVQQIRFSEYSSLYVSILLYGYFLGAPFATLLISNGVFVWALRNRTHASTSVSNEQSRAKAQNERNYILMLLVLTGSYLVLSLTNTILQMIAINVSSKDLDKKTFFAVTLEVPVIANNSLNFLFYFASGRMFRNAYRKARRHLMGRKQADNHTETHRSTANQMELTEHTAK